MKIKKSSKWQRRLELNTICRRHISLVLAARLRLNFFTTMKNAAFSALNMEIVHKLNFELLRLLVELVKQKPSFVVCSTTWSDPLDLAELLSFRLRALQTQGHFFLVVCIVSSSEVW